MRLTKYEMETILLYNEAEQTASVYTHDPKLIAKLRRLSEKYPDLIYPDKTEHGNAVSYIVPKHPRCGERKRRNSVELNRPKAICKIAQPQDLSCVPNHTRL